MSIHFTIECEKKFSHSQKVLIAGDLNSNILSSKLPGSCSFMTAFDLCEMFNEPTWITESTSFHLDVFLTKSLFSFDDVFAVPIGLILVIIILLLVLTLLEGHISRSPIRLFMLETARNLTLLCYVIYLQMNTGMLFFLSVMLTILYSVYSVRQLLILLDSAYL